MCDKNNAEEIVSEMLTYLETADYSIKEEMVLDKVECYILSMGKFIINVYTVKLYNVFFLSIM